MTERGPMQQIARRTESHDYRTMHQLYGGDERAIGGKVRHASGGQRGIGIVSTVEIDTVYLLSDCERYAVRCRASEPHMFEAPTHA